MAEPPKEPQPSKTERREARLAAALRDNLKRRKTPNAKPPPQKEE